MTAIGIVSYQVILGSAEPLFVTKVNWKVPRTQPWGQPLFPILAIWGLKVKKTTTKNQFTASSHRSILCNLQIRSEGNDQVKSRTIVYKKHSDIGLAFVWVFIHRVYCKRNVILSCFSNKQLPRIWHFMQSATKRSRHFMWPLLHVTGDSLKLLGTRWCCSDILKRSVLMGAGCSGQDLVTQGRMLSGPTALLTSVLDRVTRTSCCDTVSLDWCRREYILRGTFFLKWPFIRSPQECLAAFIDSSDAYLVTLYGVSRFEGFCMFS